MKEKIWFKKLTCYVLAGVLVLLPQRCMATYGMNQAERTYSEMDEKMLTDEEKEAVAIFLENGYEEIQFENFTMDILVSLAEKMKDNPESVEITQQFQRFDDMKNIELLVNLSEEVLVDEYGMTREEATKEKKRICELQKLSEKQLREIYEMSNDEISVLKNALKPQMDYKEPKTIKEVDKVTLSSSISSSTLSYSQAVSDWSSKSGQCYRVDISFDWIKCYYWGEFSDVIAVAWGGDLNYEPIFKNVHYYKMYGIWPAYYWTDNKKGSKAPTANEEPNKGVKFTFSQAYTKSISTSVRVKEGWISFALSNTKKKGEKTSVVSRYCHKIIGIGGVSLGSGPSISVTGAYDVTDTDKTRATIIY